MVCHFPPGTSKWNKVEHRLFSQISVTWRGEPLVSYETIINFISSTTTKTGLKVKAELDTHEYHTGKKITDKVMQTVRLDLTNPSAMELHYNGQRETFTHCAKVRKDIFIYAASATGDSYSTGQTVTLYGSFTDPVPQASRTVTIDWGDGTSGNPDTTTLPLAAGVTTFSTSARQYAASGQYIITVSVGDAVGSGPAATLPVTYNDLAPANVALSMPSTPILLNQAFDLSGTFTDPESSQSQTVIIDWGDALDGYPPDTTTVNPSPGATSFSNQPHTYSGDGSYIISVTVANSLGTSAPQTATVDVWTRPPPRISSWAASRSMPAGT